MTPREEYLHKRLMELTLIADSRELDSVEQAEERRLEEELKSILEQKSLFSKLEEN